MASPQTLIPGPGERADLIVDFSHSAGRNLYLRTAITAFLQFRVSSQKTIDSFSVPAVLDPVQPMSEAAAVQTRELRISDE